MLDNAEGLCSVKQVQPHGLVHYCLFGKDPWIHVQTLLKLCHGKTWLEWCKTQLG